MRHRIPTARQALISLVFALLFLAACAGSYTLTTKANSGKVVIPFVEFERRAGKLNAITVDVDGNPDQLLLLRNPEGQFYAVSARCTHQGCQVRPAKDFIICPCHGSTYDREGKVLRGPAQETLPGYLVEVQNGEIIIHLNTTGGSK